MVSDTKQSYGQRWDVNNMHTNNHHGEVESLLNRLAVDLVGQVCKANIALKGLLDGSVGLWKDRLAKWRIVIGGLLRTNRRSWDFTRVQDLPLTNCYSLCVSEAHN